MSENQLSKRLQDLIAVLSNSPSDELLLKHLNEIRNIGNEHLIKPMVHILVNTTNDQVYEEITQVLFELKNQQCIVPLLELIQDKSTVEHRDVLVSALWQSNLRCEAYVKTLVDIALENDYLTCIEVLTVIENLSNGIPDQDLIDGLHKIDEYLNSHKDVKNSLLQELKAILEQFLMK